MPDLVLLFLLVSCLSLVFQVLAFARLASHARTPAGELIRSGHLRTVACRVLAATVYVAVAAVQLAGSGTLSAEALLVFGAIQGLWVTNSLLDIRTRRELGRQEEARMPADEEQQLARIAAVADQADQILNQIESSVADLKTILGRLAAAAEIRKREETP